MKVNNKLSMRISVKDVIMQGSVWSSLKCTTSMDRLNQTALADEAFKYCYKGDPEVPIGIPLECLSVGMPPSVRMPS